jgi:hypothetical protein
MLQTLIRVALQVVLFFLLLGVVVAIGDTQTGAVEKLALAVLGLLLVGAAAMVRRIRAA